MSLAEMYAAQRADGSTDIYQHLPTLYQAIIDLDAKTIVEVGTGSGRATTALLWGAAQTGGHVWSCDIREQQHDAALNDEPHFTFVVGDSLEVVDQAPRPIDLLMIDSEHTFLQTLGELEAYGPLVRPGGRIYLHDTAHIPGVVDAIGWWCDTRGLTWTNNNACYGLGLIICP